MIFRHFVMQSSKPVMKGFNLVHGIVLLWYSVSLLCSLLRNPVKKGFNLVHFLENYIIFYHHFAESLDGIAPTECLWNMFVRYSLSCHSKFSNLEMYVNENIFKRQQYTLNNLKHSYFLTSSRLSDIRMRLQARPAFFQVCFFSPVRCQAIILLFCQLDPWNKLPEFLILAHQFSFKKSNSEISSAKKRSLCLELDVFTTYKVLAGFLCSMNKSSNIVEIRQSYDRLISTMWFPLLVRYHLYTESGPRSCYNTVQHNTIWYIAHKNWTHYNDVIMSAMASQITSLTVVYSTVYSRRRSKKTSKLRVTGEFPAQRASNVENVSIWWRNHVQTDNTYLAIAGKISWLGVCWGYFRYACWWYNGRFPTFGTVVIQWSG